MEKPVINIIIPCFNEAKLLPLTLSALKRQSLKEACRLNVILMDNGSTDSSVEIAAEFGASIYVDRDATIAKLRNSGVSKTDNHGLLIFIDADIEVTDIWMKSVCELALDSASDPLYVTGYPCMPPKKASWVERHWFGHQEINTNYINSGNMITRRELFDRIKGFDETLKTGEDWDFCYRARNIGAVISPREQFLVHHNGYPGTLVDFLKREMWHGMGDCQNLRSFLRSKPALSSFFWGVTWISGIALIWSQLSTLLGVILMLLGSVPAILLAYKRNRNWRYFPGNFIIALTYLGGRLGSILLTLYQKTAHRYHKDQYRWR